MLAKMLRSEGVASVLDQGVVSGGNFLSTLVLARIMAPASYGLFSLLFLSLIAINTCHSSLVVYPLTLQGAASPSKLRSLTVAALIHTLLLSLPLALMLAIIAGCLHQLRVWPLLALAMLSWQIQETVRRALLSVLRFRSAILPDTLCYLGQGCILLLMRPENLSVIFAVVAITSLMAAAWQLALIPTEDSPETSLPAFTKAHGSYAWKLGRYVLAGNALNMLTLQIPSWTLAFAFAPSAVAGFQCLLNLVGVANPVIFSINSMLIPTIAKEAVNGYRAARLTALRYGLRFSVLLVPAFIVMILAPHTVMRLVYGSASPYLPLAWLLRIFVVAFAVQYLATVVGAYEGGMSRPKTYMWVQMVGTGFLAVIGTAIIYRFGIAGAVVAMMLASTVRFVTFIVVAHRSDTSGASGRLGLTKSLEPS